MRAISWICTVNLVALTGLGSNVITSLIYCQYFLHSVNTVCVGRYCKLLVQEFAVKLDQGFLIAVLSMFEMTAMDEESHRLVAFQRDCEVVDCSLMDDMVHTTAGTAKNFYDMLHFSPLKVSSHYLLLLYL